MVIREIVLDTETTGLNPLEGHKIIEIGCVELVNRQFTGNTFHKYIKPMRSVPLESQAVHGITTEFLADKPRFEEVANEFIEFVGQDSKLVIHNANFDMSFLNSELSQLNIKTLTYDRVVDTLPMARKKFPKAPASLDALCQRFRISLKNREKHGALIDAHLLAQVYLELIQGDQSSLMLETSLNDTFEFLKVTDFPRRSFPISKEQEEEHKRFIEEKIKNSAWFTS